MRGMSMYLRRDEGMTIVEVVVASAILFIIMTAVLGLVGQTISMGDQATRMNVGTNALNAYVEWVRSLPFDQVESVETTVVVTDEYTVTIVPTVTGESENLRDMYLVVTLERAGVVADTFDTMVIIRNRDQTLTDSERSATTDPKVYFESPTPPDGAILYLDDMNNSHWIDPTDGSDHAPIQFGLRTWVSPGRTMEYVRIQTVDLTTLQNVSDEFAMWEQPDWSVLPTPFSWDLASQDASGVALFTIDGHIEVEVYALDDAEADAVRPRRFYLLDNDPPSQIGVGSEEIYDNPDADRFWRDPAGSMGGTLKWLLTMDGTIQSDHYELEILKVGWNGALTGTDRLVTTSVNVVETKDLSMVVPAEGEFVFNRFIARVRAESPRENWATEGSDEFSGPWEDLGPWPDLTTMFYTRPTIAGGRYNAVLAANKKSWTIQPELTASVPQFPYASAPIYEWHRVQGATDTVVQSTASNVYKPTATYTVAEGAVAPSYYAIVKVDPWDGASTTYQFRSETVASAWPTANGWVTFPAGTW